MKRIFIFLGIIQAFTALGAIPAGIIFLTDTSGAGMGNTTTMLKNSPFETFLIPGLFLLIINGLGSATGVVFIFIFVILGLLFKSFTGDSQSLIIISPFLLVGILFILHRILSQRSKG